MIADREQTTAEIAAQLRATRARRGWTLDELAARSGVSRRLIVQLEQGEGNPSLATLLKLARALGITLANLLSPQSQDRAAARVRGEDAMTLWSTAAGSTARLLVSHGPLELWTWKLEPGDRRVSHPHRPGSLELLTVQAGTLDLEVDGHRVQIPRGDSAWFDATHPHAYENSGAKAVGFTLVVLEPPAVLTAGR